MPQSATNLWRRISQFYYALAVERGYSGGLTPNALDGKIQSMRKTCFYTAFIVDQM